MIALRRIPSIQLPGWMVVASIALVSGWTYFFVTHKPRSEPDGPDGPAVDPDAPWPVEPFIVPINPDNPAPSPGGSTPMIQWLGNPLSLQQGRTYRGRLELTGIKASLASASDVVSKFREVGFSNVSASRTAGADWPAEATQSPGKGTWFVQGTWSQPSQNAERPPELTRAWVAA